MTAQHQCCSYDLPADMRALVRACNTAARLTANERGRVIREAGDESTSASPEFNRLVDSVADYKLITINAGALVG